jgi:glycosyltransferase involved in cell wall biosynthesis
MTMRCLWLTAADPAPENNGQYIYSGRLIDAAARAGAAIDVLCLARDGSDRQNGQDDGNVRWWLTDGSLAQSPRSLLSSLPNVAHRTATPAMRRKLDVLLERERWTGIVIDGISVGWTIGAIRRRYPRGGGPPVVYVAHNHEESLRAQLARHQRNPVLRPLYRVDAAKVARLERALVDAVDLVTAITPDDRARYLTRRPDRRVLVLPPGYGARPAPERTITADLPRRVVLVGSFEWVAKRMNIEEFLAAADPVFAAAGIELQVVGAGSPQFMRRLSRRSRAATLVGAVDSVQPYIDRARLAIVPERTGGGFKLKVLDYVFNRLPIAALEHAVAGVPLRAHDSILLYPDHRSLALGVREAIDDLGLLNRLHRSAYAACAGRFDWASRGRGLIEAMAAA